MVFFTCNACGESLKKNKVDKHLSQCRTNTFSCMDCGKDFAGSAYNSHNECVSEDQKYGGIDFKAKESSQKGKLKQEVWIQKIKNAINESNGNKHINDLMQRLLDFDNIPRKKQKFFNFVKNCVKVRNDYYIQQMWDMFESATKTDPIIITRESNNHSFNSNNHSNTASKETDSTTNGNNKRELNQSEIDDLNATKKTKQIHNESESFNKFDESIQNSTLDSNCQTKQKLKMNKIIVEILKNNQNNEMSVRKLRKKVLKVYKSNEDYCKETVAEKFENKIKSHKKLITSEGKVALIQK